MTYDWSNFSASLKEETCPPNYGLLLKALWTDAKGDWREAHSLVDNSTTTESAWVHAYLHRKEGDLSYADYWYRRANRKRPSITLVQEWEELVKFFLEK